MARGPECSVGGIEEGDKALMPNDPPISPKAADATLGVSAPIVRISPLFEALLHSANGLLKADNPSAAVLVAQTAIEVCTERLITRLLDKRGTSFLAEWIDDSLVNYNIASEKVRKLYEAVSTDKTIAQQPFWSLLQAHVQLRNDIAHQGRFATQTQGQASHDVAWQVVRYLSDTAGQHSIDLDR